GIHTRLCRRHGTSSGFSMKSPTIRRESSGGSRANWLRGYSSDAVRRPPGPFSSCRSTSQEPRAGIPVTMRLESVRLPKPSWAKISQVRTLSVQRLGRRVGRLVPEELDRLVEGLNEIIAG